MLQNTSQDAQLICEATRYRYEARIFWPEMLAVVALHALTERIDKYSERPLVEGMRALESEVYTVRVLRDIDTFGGSRIIIVEFLLSE